MSKPYNNTLAKTVDALAQQYQQVREQSDWNFNKYLQYISIDEEKAIEYCEAYDRGITKLVTLQQTAEMIAQAHGVPSERMRQSIEMYYEIAKKQEQAA